MKQAATQIFLIILLLYSITGYCVSVASPPTPSNPLSQKVTSFNNLPIEVMEKLLIAEMALHRQQFDIALENYIAVALETQDVNIAARATEIAISQGALETAIQPALIWAQKAQNDLEAQITTAALLIKNDQITDAIPYLDQIHVLEPDIAFEQYLVLFEQLPDPTDQENVIKALVALSKHTPKALSPYLALSQIYLLQGDFNDAIKITQKTIKQFPKDESAIILHAQALHAQKGPLATQKFLTAQVETQPNNINLLQFYITWLFENDQPSKAHQKMKKLLTFKNLAPQQILAFANLSMQANWLNEAQQLLLRLTDDPEYGNNAKYFLARLHEIQNQEEKAIEWYQQVTEGSYHLIAQIRASVLLTLQNQHDKALTLLRKIVPAYQEDVKRIVLTKVEILVDAERYEEALTLLNDEIQSSTNDIELRYVRSLVFEALNQIDNAETELLSILEEQPNHVDALNALGFILTEHSNRYEDAFFYLTKAMGLSPNNAMILDSMGWLQYKLKNYPLALKHLTKAYELIPDPEIAAHLIEVLWRTNQKTEAKKLLQKTLEQHPKNKTILKVIEKLQIPR